MYDSTYIHIYKQYTSIYINTSNFQSTPQQPNLHRAMRQVQKPVNNVDYMPLEVSCRVPLLVVLYVFESLIKGDLFGFCDDMQPTQAQDSQDHSWFRRTSIYIYLYT